MKKDIFKKKIAVIGAGVAGLTASYLLSKRHEVTLFESHSQLGGHAHSISLRELGCGEEYVDTAFLIFNELTYKNFFKFIDALEVSKNIIPAEMSSCFSDQKNNLHYTLGLGWKGFLKRPARLFKIELLRIYFDLRRFKKQALKDLHSQRNLSGITTHEYLKSYSKPFKENFVYPLTSAIWSLPTNAMHEFPISSLIDYFNNHQLLTGPKGKYWKTFKGSSQVYIRAFEDRFKGQIKKNNKVLRVRRGAESISVLTSQGLEHFNEVVFATHADLTLKLIENPTEQEKQILGVWRYKDNPVTLHQEERALFKDSALWCSWNMKRTYEDYQISYYLNRLQNLTCREPIVLTLGEYKASSDKIFKTFNYRHPIFDALSAATQTHLPSLNGVDRIYFCGSYFGHGFHEDACKSAVQIASHFDVTWNTKDIS